MKTVNVRHEKNRPHGSHVRACVKCIFVRLSRNERVRYWLWQVIILIIFVVEKLAPNTPFQYMGGILLMNCLDREVMWHM